jgi:uncharacterized protein (DUF58 family)
VISAFVRQWREDWLGRHHPPGLDTQQLGWRRIYILPTHAGAGFAFLLLLMLIGAINYQLSLAFFLTFLLAGVMHAAMLRTYARLLGLKIRVHAGEPVFAGENASFRIDYEAPPPRHGLCFSLANAPIPARDGQLFLPATERGLLNLPRIKVECRQPTGWFRAWSYLHFSTTTLVYPAPERSAPPLPLCAQTGSGQARIISGDDDFSGLRSYQPGDARRLIAWKQMARTGELLSRQFQAQAGSETVLDWQTLATLEHEARIARLCAWILAAEAAGHHYALQLPGQYIAPGQGEAHCKTCLAALALFPRAAR